VAERDKTKGTPEKEPIRSVWEEARDLIKRLEGSTVQRLSVEAGEFKVEIERGIPGRLPQPEGAQISDLGTSTSADGGNASAAALPDDRHPILAPLVGTFYRSPQPGAKPFVEEGDAVDVGQTLAIVEAMKLMNKVAADRAGKVGAILANDGDWVEFEQVLMYVEPAEE
jgi:acetyl-CoA carboxylase biotin carboxyl carrier protein